MKPIWRAYAIPALLALGLAGCVVANPYPPVPPLMVEAMPKPPVTTTPLIWRPGHWDWTGNSYVWIPGEYIPHPGHTMWVHGFWARTESGWVWQPAHWQ